MVEIRKLLGLEEKEQSPVVKRSEIPTDPGVEGVVVHPGEHLEAEEITEGGEVVAAPPGSKYLPIEVPPLSREQIQQLKTHGAGESAGWLGTLIERLQLKRNVGQGEEPA